MHKGLITQIKGGWKTHLVPLSKALGSGPLMETPGCASLCSLLPPLTCMGLLVVPRTLQWHQPPR